MYDSLVGLQPRPRQRFDHVADGGRGVRGTEELSLALGEGEALYHKVPPGNVPKGVG